MPSIGARRRKAARNMLPRGFWKFVVHSVKEVLLMSTNVTVLRLLTMFPPRVEKPW